MTPVLAGWRWRCRRSSRRTTSSPVNVSATVPIRAALAEYGVVRTYSKTSSSTSRRTVNGSLAASPKSTPFSSIVRRPTFGKTSRSSTRSGRSRSRTSRRAPPLVRAASTASPWSPTPLRSVTGRARSRSRTPRPIATPGVYNNTALILAPFGSTLPRWCLRRVRLPPSSAATYGGNHIPDVVTACASIRRRARCTSVLPCTPSPRPSTPTAGAAGNGSSSATPTTPTASLSSCCRVQEPADRRGDSLKIEAVYARARPVALTGGTTDTSGGGRFAAASEQLAGLGSCLRPASTPTAAISFETTLGRS